MTLSSIIQQVDDIKPNAFTNDTKTAWINEVEGLVQTEVMLLAIDDVIQYDYETDKNTVMLVKPPHDKIYWTYLTALIDFANGEYNKYQNTMQMFNSYFGEYMRWYALHYRPADGEAIEQGYYISAYGIAVKHGYEGTEEQWLASLKGEQGASVEMQYDQESLEIQYRYVGQEKWTELLDMGQIESEVVEEETAKATQAASAAQAAEEAAKGYAQSASSAKQDAETASSAAEGFALAAGQADSRAQGAKTAAASSATQAGTAQEQAQTAADDAAASATLAQNAAQAAEEYSQSGAQSVESAAGSAVQAQSWAIGGTGTRTGEDANNAKYWCESAQQAAGGGVMSFNGRTGSVMPQSGDYTASMVGAATTSQIISLVSSKAEEADLTAHTGDTSNPHGVTAQQAGAVPEGRTVNGKALTGNIALTATDVGARPDTWTPTASDVGARPDTWMPTAAEVGADPTGTAAGLMNRTSGVNASDTSYTSYIARGESLNAEETTPTVNGAIAWTYG